LQAEQHSRALLNRELIHRGHNTLAQAQAIVSQTLRSDPNAARAINGRLQALANTNDLLTSSPLQIGLLDQILKTELVPYGLERISLSGPELALPAEMARAIGLIVHELATNAAKYGALSSVNGRLAVAWTIEGNRARLAWTESNGPMVNAPTRTSFGSTLIKSLIAMHGGQSHLDYQPTGLVCSLNFEMPIT
jgi:two-component sensor histidine kinase